MQFNPKKDNLKIKISPENSIDVFSKLLNYGGMNNSTNEDRKIKEPLSGYAYLFRTSGDAEYTYIGWTGDYITEDNKDREWYYEDKCEYIELSALQFLGRKEMRLIL